METPLMEVTRFDTEDVIATSTPGPGPGPVTGHSWDAANKQIICPNGYNEGWHAHYIIESIYGDHASGTAYVNTMDPMNIPAYFDGDFVPGTQAADLVVGTWYTNYDEDWLYMCGSGQ